MKLLPTITDVEIRHFHFFCGLGGGALGFNRGEARVGNARAKFRCIGGIDSDPAAVADFSRAADVPGTMRDLFSREQYCEFHGKEPPADWREALPVDIRLAAGSERPHIIFFSAPCKGFSGLLSETLSRSGKYQALNGLTLRGVWLALEAWKDDPPELIVFENVPRIAKRGRHLLDQIVQLFRSFGYAVAETTHDCGELGGLGQSRKRFLLVARHIEKVPPFLYEPIKHPLRGVGEIIGRFPVPGPDLVLPMHRMPSLQWKTWVRLAFVEAGADWRSLNRLNVQDGFLADFGIEPGYGFHSVLGVNHWEDPTGAVTSRAGPTNGRNAIADPRAPEDAERASYGVGRWDTAAATITSQRSPGQGRFSVADPRLDADRRGPFGVTPWNKEAATVAGESFPTNGPFTVADPRIDGHAKSVQMGVGTWEAPAAVVKGDVSVGTGRYAVADPRMGPAAGGKPRFNHVYRIVPWASPAPAVAGGGGPAGGLAVADPRTGYGPNSHRNKLAVVDWRERAGTVTGSDRVGSGALSVADPRTGFGAGTHHNVLQVHRWDERSKTVTSGNHPSGGALSVADPRQAERADYKQTKYRVTGFDEAAGAVIGASTTGNGAFAVADPRPDCLKEEGDAYLSGGHYGVVPWERHSNAVSASALHDNGFNSVADPRESGGTYIELPNPNDRLVCCIRAMDGTWHRPFTTLELAALQGLVDPEETLILDGLSDSAWRERIGNAVPPPAAAAIASVMGRTLLMAWSGQTFMLSSEPIWVRPIAVGLSVDIGAAA